MSGADYFFYFKAIFRCQLFSDRFLDRQLGPFGRKLDKSGSDSGSAFSQINLASAAPDLPAGNPSAAYFKARLDSFLIYVRRYVFFKISFDFFLIQAQFFFSSVFVDG